MEAGATSRRLIPKSILLINTFTNRWKSLHLDSFCVEEDMRFESVGPSVKRRGPHGSSREETFQ